MKNILMLVISTFTYLVLVPQAIKAYEGSVELSGSGVSCKASSVWHESRYRIIGRCDGLVYPYETQYEYYTIWAHDVARDSYVRIDDVDRGYFEGDMNSPFDKMMVTAEQDGGPRRPSDKTVANGNVVRFEFDKSAVAASTEPATTTNKDTAESKTMTVQSTAKSATTTSTGSAASVVGRIITSLLVIILIVVGVVIAGSLLFRSRGSVSH